MKIIKIDGEMAEKLRVSIKDNNNNQTRSRCNEMTLPFIFNNETYLEMWVGSKRAMDEGI